MTASIDLPGLVRRYGDFSLAASTDQPGIRLFGDADGVIAYREVRIGAHTLHLALGEPLADPHVGGSVGMQLVGEGQLDGELTQRELDVLRLLGGELTSRSRVLR